MAPHSSTLAWRIQGRGSLVGCRLWGRTESDMTEATQQQKTFKSKLRSLTPNQHPENCIPKSSDLQNQVGSNMWQQKCSHPHPHLSHNDVPVICTPKLPRQKAACGGRVRTGTHSSLYSPHSTYTQQATSEYIMKCKANSQVNANQFTEQDKKWKATWELSSGPVVRTWCSHP